MIDDVEAVGIGRNTAAGIGEAVRTYECGEILGPGGDKVSKCAPRRAVAVNIADADRASSRKVYIKPDGVRETKGRGCAL